MNMNGNWDEIGNEIRDAVEDSLRTGDFSKIGNVVSNTVNGVADEAKRQVKQYTYRKQSSYPKQTAYQQAINKGNVYPRAQQRKPVFLSPVAIFKRKGTVSGPLLTIFGAIGTGIMSLVELILLIILATTDPAAIVGVIVCGVILGGFIAMIASGVSQKKLLDRAERYLAICKGKSYVNISELAISTNRSEGFVRRDVKRMMARGIFPQGHLDLLESCLMISDDTYREYLTIEKQRKDMELDEFAKQRQIGEAEEMHWRSLSGIEDPSDEIKKNHPKLAKMIWQGQECTGHIREMNENMPGEVISRKLSTLENVLKEIFKRVREHPEQMGKMQKFMDYYLPTTLKLVEAYEEFDRIASPNEEILEAKAELEKTLDTINQSFEELLNQLFSDAAFDVTTDAKVLQTLLAKDGLAKDHAFDTNK